MSKAHQKVSTLHYETHNIVLFNKKKKKKGSILDIIRSFLLKGSDLYSKCRHWTFYLSNSNNNNVQPPFPSSISFYIFIMETVEGPGYLLAIIWVGWCSPPSSMWCWCWMVLSSHSFGPKSVSKQIIFFRKF